MNISKKIALVGYFGVGKTSLLRRFIDNTFSEEYKVTLGVQIKKKIVEISDKEEMTLIIWDLEGNTSITKTRRSYLLGTDAFIYVFDATRIETYKNINEDIEFIKENYPATIIKVIGNKSDLVNKKSLKEILKSKKIMCNYITSAKTGDNVELMFKAIATELKM